jgi:dolichol-phosphate mannosyltransferase
MKKLSGCSPKILTIIPAYNEAENIGQVLDKVFKCPVITQILVIDDCSKDKTATIAQQKGAKVICHAKNMGVGAALRTGIDYAIKEKFDIVTIVVGDDQHNPDEIPALIEPILSEDYVFCIGSRYLKPSGFINPSFCRLILTKLYSFIFSLITGSKFTDVTNSFRAFRIDIFQDKKINIWQNWLNTYELEPYLFYQLVKRGYRIKEIPATVIYHQKAKSNIKPVIGWWRILRPIVLLKLGLKK